MNAILKPINPDKHPTLALVPQDALADVWPRIAHFIEAALEHGQGDESATDVLLSCARSQYLLVTDGESMAAVFQYVKHPRQSVVTLLYAGGSIDACYRAFEFAKDFFRSQGVQALRIWGRPGWKRVLGLETIGEIMQVRL